MSDFDNDKTLGPNQEKWVKALESGNYKQFKGALGKSFADGGDAFCCLGVACKIFNDGNFINLSHFGNYYYYNNNESFVLPDNIAGMLGMRRNGAFLDRGEEISISGFFSLTEMNDYGITFEGIAGYIRKYPHLIFAERK